MPNGEARRYTVKSARPHKKVQLVCLEKIDHIDQAEPLVGSEVYVERADLPPLEKGTYYWSDIIGLSVFTIDGGFLGRVVGVIPTGSNDVYVVSASSGDKQQEVLVPALESVVLDIDLKQKTMRVDLPDGLVEEALPVGTGDVKRPAAP
jgi:16S rRNA processing protein RimM